MWSYESKFEGFGVSNSTQEKSLCARNPLLFPFVGSAERSLQMRKSYEVVAYVRHRGFYGWGKQIQRGFLWLIYHFAPQVGNTDMEDTGAMCASRIRSFCTNTEGMNQSSRKRGSSIVLLLRADYCKYYRRRKKPKEERHWNTFDINKFHWREWHNNEKGAKCTGGNQLSRKGDIPWLFMFVCGSRGILNRTILTLSFSSFVSFLGPNQKYVNVSVTGK